MKCPFCSGPTKVLLTRNTIRNRKCVTNDHRFQTDERVVAVRDEKGVYRRVADRART